MTISVIFLWFFKKFKKSNVRILMEHVFQNPGIWSTYLTFGARSGPTAYINSFHFFFSVPLDKIYPPSRHKLESFCTLKVTAFPVFLSQNEISNQQRCRNLLRNQQKLNQSTCKFSSNFTPFIFWKITKIDMFNILTIFYSSRMNVVLHFAYAF